MTLSPEELRDRPPARKERRRAGRDAAFAGETQGQRHQRHDRERAERRKRRGPWLAMGRAMVRWLPLPVAAMAGHAFGAAAYCVAGAVRRRTLANLEAAFGSSMTPAERRRTARRCFALAGRGVFSWIVLHRMGADRCMERIEFVCDPAIREEMKRGAIVLSQHFGAFEVTVPALHRNFGVRPVGADAKPGSATEELVRMRRDMGGETIEQGNARELMKHLRDGGAAGMLMDQDIRRVNGAFVPFFGRPAHTPVGPATFAVRLGIPLVLIKMEWTSLTRHRLTVGPVLRPREDLPKDDAILELTARATAAGEAIIRSRPDHWLWMHDRWRTKPGDRPDAPHWPRTAAEEESAT